MGKRLLLALALSLAARARAADVVKPVDLGPAAVPLSPALPSVPSTPSLPELPGVEAPAPQAEGASAALPAVPALPASAVAAPAPPAGSAAAAGPLKVPLAEHVLLQQRREEAAGAPTAAGTLRELAQAAEASRNSGAPSGLDDRAYDGATLHSFAELGAHFGRTPSGADSGAPGGGRGSGASPKLPPGVVRVDVHVVHTAADIDRLIPDGANSRGLIDGLKRQVRTMAPYRIYRYFDAKGGVFTGIDLSQNPKLVEILPEQHSHEVKLIKKIQLYNKDLQVIVREDGKTPDLVLGGVVTELKSLIGDKVDVPFLINKANTQVYEHARRHGLGPGAAAIDLTQEEKVPAQQVLRDLNAWAAQPVGHAVRVSKTGEEHKKSPVWLEKVYVFAGLDVTVFARQADGTFAVEDPSRIPFSKPQPPPVDPKDVHTVQLLLKSGRINAARRQLRAVEKKAPVQPSGSPILQARERVDAHRFVEAVRKLSRKRRFGSALALWDNFKTTHSPDAVHEIEAQVRAILPAPRVPDAVAAAAADDDGARIKREIEGPRAALAAAGIKATIMVYGSARILPRAEAQRAYDELLARVGPRPVQPADEQALAAAKQALDNSRYYEEARKLGALAARLGGGRIAVGTGGGPGIMEAANRGAFEGGGPSIGHNIVLPREQQPNRYQTPGLSFRYESFAARKANTRFGAMAYVYFPGGFGTMDELFELLTLMQTGKIPKTPIVLFGEREYWSTVLDFDRFAQLGLISPEDLRLFRYAETADQAWAIVSAARD